MGVWKLVRELGESDVFQESSKILPEGLHVKDVVRLQGRVAQWTLGPVGGPVVGQASGTTGRIYRQMDRGTDRQVDRGTDRWTER